MREIKLRYKYEGPSAIWLRTFTLDQVEGGDHFDEISDSPLLKDYRITGKELFTGLKDKNGVEIYAGDVVYFPHIDNVKDIKVIKWSQDDAGFVADKPDGTPDSWIDDTAEVIGNIHSNPELLK